MLKGCYFSSSGLLLKGFKLFSNFTNLNYFILRCLKFLQKSLIVLSKDWVNFLSPFNKGLCINIMFTIPIFTLWNPAEGASLLFHSYLFWCLFYYLVYHYFSPLTITATTSSSFTILYFTLSL